MPFGLLAANLEAYTDKLDIHEAANLLASNVAFIKALEADVPNGGDI